MKICSNCGKENSAYNERCINCNNNFNANSVNSNENVSNFFGLVFKFIFLWPIISIGLGGIFFFIVGFSLNFNEKKLMDNYIEVTGVLIEMGGCDDDGVCSAYYRYVVDGIEYTASPDLLSNSFPQTASVYYNPNNPSESVMDSGWNNIWIVGLVIIVIFVVIGIVIKKKMTSFKNNINNSRPINI